MAKGGHTHRSTLKKDHKPFKSKHSSKGSLKNQNKGRIDKSNGGGKAQRVISKVERKNLAKQIKEKKLNDSKVLRRLFEGSQGAEKIVTVIVLTPDLNCRDIVSTLVKAAGVDDFEPIDISDDSPMVADVKIDRFRSKLKIIVPNSSDLISILDATKVSDFVVFGLSATEEVSQDFGETILRAVIAQGVASVIGVLPNVVSAYPKRNLQQDIRQSLSSFFNHFFPEEEKLFALENPTESANCIRTICQKFPKSISWRDSRAYAIADKVGWEGDEDGVLVVEATTRGIGFNANRLVHIPGLGDYQLARIEKLTGEHVKGNMDVETSNVLVPNEFQETLDELNPYEEEMEDEDFEAYDNSMGFRMEGKQYFSEPEVEKSKKKVPKGTSEYQARWILSDDESDSEDESELDEPQEEDLDMGDNMEAETESQNAETNDDMDVYEEMSPEEEERQLEEFRKKAKEDAEFPDEDELHPQESAKEKFSAYRGVKSLGSNDWEVDEKDPSTPSIWKRLLRISSYRATKNRVTKNAIKEAQVNIGNKVRLYIKTPSFVLNDIDINKKPFIIHSLLEHEHKLGVVNFSFEHWEEYDEPIASNETIIVQYGPRRQVIEPIFSQASNTPNNVHKTERFIHPGSQNIATTIAPVMFNNAPAIFFKIDSEGRLQLIGKGTFLNADHTRILAERVILTGHPIKINKRLVTIRYMFFNPEDINWFKSVPLFTKSGRTGFIKESLGTHGYFKATFDGKLTSQDVVAMSLYKRNWPVVSSQWTN